MITLLILIFTALTVLITLILTNRTGEKENGTIILGVTLPFSELKNKEVLKIVQEYHKKTNLAGIVFFVLLFPSLIFSKYDSISLIYFSAWCGLIFYVNNIIQKTYFYRLYSLKIKNSWFVGTKNGIYVDTEVTRLKGKMIVSKLWFAFPILMIFIPLILFKFDLKNNVYLWICFICSVLSVIIGMFAYWCVSKERTVTYSEDSEINFVLNQVYKYQWSKCWIIEACIGSSLYTLLFFLESYNDFQPVVMILFIGISTCLTLLPILSCYNKIREKRCKLFAFNSMEDCVDDDQYWEGANYNNPTDNRIFVEARFGYGTTVNMASTFGKLTKVFLFVITIGVIGLSLFLMPMDFGRVDFKIKNNKAYIDAPMYEDNFSIDEISTVEQIETLPKMNKRSGGDSSKFYVGSFNVEKYGESSVYVHRDSKSYIVVTLSNRIVIFNGDTMETTKEYYLKLIKSLKL